MNENIFYKNYPIIDLHGYDSQSAKVATNDFIEENIFLNKEYILIVHGIGLGIVKRSVHEALSVNKKVKNYKVDNLNPGATIVQLFLDKH